MAITRAQQAKQMLQDGGMLVKPSTDGKRPGYSNPNEDRARERERAAANRESRRGSQYDAPSKQSTYSSEIEDEIVTRGDTTDRRETLGLTPRFMPSGGEQETPEELKDRRDRQRRRYQDQFTSRGIVPPGPNQKSRQRALNFLNRNMSRYLNRFGSYYDPSKFSVTETGYPDFGFPSLYRGIGEELEARGELKDILKTGNMIPIGKSGTSFEMSAVPDLDIDSIRELAATQTTMQSAPLTGFQADALEDLRETINKRDKLIETGDTSGIFPGPPTPNPDDDPTDPCLGPNPPEYCFVNKNPTTPETPTPKRNLGGLTARIGGSLYDFDKPEFAADGGRIGAMDGGIMSVEDLDREAFLLGGLAKGLKKAVRGVKKLAKSPIGKVALLAAGAGYGGFGPLKGLFSGVKGAGFLKSMAVNKSLLGTSDYMGGSTGILDFIKANPFKTIGGISLLSGLMTPKEDEDDDFMKNYYDMRLEPTQSVRGMGSEFEFYKPQFAADGGRIGYDTAGAVMSKEDMEKLSNDPLYKGFKTMYKVDPDMAKDNEAYKDKFEQFEQLFKKGYQEGGDVEPVAKKTMPLIDMDGKEKDYRETGGFVDMGRMEKADDVPARLSKNEFVFTADAVRNAGDGNVDKGAEVMYNMMKNLEAGGEVSEESQGLEGAREMFQTSQRLGEVI